MFDNVALVWADDPDKLPPHPKGMGCTVALWTSVLGCPAIGWDHNNPATMPDLSAYDTFLVNVLGVPDLKHISQLRQRYPDATVIAMPDPSLDLMLMREKWRPLFHELKQAHAIAGRTYHDAQLYEPLLNIPAYQFGSPVGPAENLLPYRSTVKGDYILAIDHMMRPRMEAHNYAVLAEVQRRTGAPIRVHANDVKEARFWCDITGIDADIYGRVPMAEFVEIIAKARITVDLYARHSFHRHGVLSAYLGTPVVSTAWTPDVGQAQVAGPFSIDHAAQVAVNLLEHDDFYKIARQTGFSRTERYGFAGSRKRLEQLLESVNRYRYSIKRGYTHRASPEYKDYTGTDGGQWQAAVYEVAREWAMIPNAIQRVVDLGCGNGEKLVQLHSTLQNEGFSPSMVGVDYGPNIKSTRARYPGFDWIDTDLEATMLHPVHFSGEPENTLYICADVLEHLRQPGILLRNLHRSLEPQTNYAVLSTPDRDLYWGEDHQGPPPNPRHIREWNMAEFSEMLKNYGFNIESAQHVPSKRGDTDAKTICVVVSRAGA
jgi:2-polyprenyl-3-methyl-5-hydroxy-6-metoxy-1,4-benzoquinol methylase